MRNHLSLWTNPWNPASDWFAASPVVEALRGEDLFSPPVEVEEEKDYFLITLDVPGVSKDAIKIEVEGNKLSVSGERKTRKFERTFDLGEHVDAEKIEAAYQDGVLKIKLAKAEKAKPRQITVKTDDGGQLFEKSEKPVN